MQYLAIYCCCRVSLHCQDNNKSCDDNGYSTHYSFRLIPALGKTAFHIKGCIGPIFNEKSRMYRSRTTVILGLAIKFGISECASVASFSVLWSSTVSVCGSWALLSRSVVRGWTPFHKRYEQTSSFMKSQLPRIACACRPSTNDETLSTHWQHRDNTSTTKAAARRI